MGGCQGLPGLEDLRAGRGPRGGPGWAEGPQAEWWGRRGRRAQGTVCGGTLAGGGQRSCGVPSRAGVGAAQAAGGSCPRSAGRVTGDEALRQPRRRPGQRRGRGRGGAAGDPRPDPARPRRLPGPLLLGLGVRAAPPPRPPLQSRCPRPPVSPPAGPPVSPPRRARTPALRGRSPVTGTPQPAAQTTSGPCGPRRGGGGRGSGPGQSEQSGTG